MKSNNQRKEQIKARRLERAAKLAKDYAARDVGALQAGRPVPGMALADQEILARYNNTYGILPRYYLDHEFRCHDCGALGVWTAKQQKWWYEVIHASINTQAVRCLACRRARRARESANPLHQQCDRLRRLGDKPPTPQAQTEVEAALQNKWWSVRMVAIQVLERWGGPQQIAQLQALVAASAGHEYWDWEKQAADRAKKALWRLQQGTP